MPAATPKRCRQGGCGKSTIHRHGYCDTHAELGKSNWHKREKAKGNRHQRGYGSEWDKLRKIVLKRDEYLCQSCLKVGVVTQGTHVDHIKPKSQGGSNELNNLQTLCIEHHNNKTATEQGRGY